MKSFLSIKDRLLIFALSISLIPIAVITTIYYFHSRSALKFEIIEKLKAVAESRERHILSTMEKMKVQTGDFSSEEFIRKSFEKIVLGRASKQDAVIRLNTYLKKNKLPLHSRRLMAIILVDKHGKVISSTNEKLIGMDFSSQDIFTQGIHKGYGEVSVGQPHSSSYLDKNYICISAPIISKHSAESLGIIINVYSLAILNEITTNRVGMGETGEVYLVNRDKIMLTESLFIEDAPLKLIVDTEPVRRIIENGKKMVGIYKDYRGLFVAGVSMDLPEYNWILLAETNKADAFAPLKMLSIVALILGVVGVAAVTSLGIAFAVSTSRPIENLTIATTRLAAGDLGYRLKITRGDEIGFLTNSFNTMAEKLEKANDELRKLFNAVEQSPVTVVITDTKGDIEYVNPKFTQTTGYTSDEAIKQNSRILKSGKQSPEVYKHLWDTILSGKEWRGEFHNKKKNDELYWELASISPIRNSAGVITHFLAVKENITERKLAEEKLQQSATELKRSNEELQHFAYIASHDLQEPLRMISSYLQLIEKRYKGKLDTDADEFIGYAVDGASRLQKMINALLEYSRVDTSGRQFESTNGAVALEQAIANLKVTIEESGAVVTHDPLPTVMVDGSQFPRIFQNLIGNAIKFRGKEPPHVHISSRRMENEWVFSVQDNGIGIGPEYHQRLFAIFKRLHGREYPGLGLGLSICKKIIKRHGGQIWVESGHGKGSTFYFTIPMRGEKKQA
ncbi:MAG: ATP-binding protein [Candidatus Brocadia sp.]|nr:ATP-binding protein [Candidatus Brocadia sp.]